MSAAQPERPRDAGSTPPAARPAGIRGRLRSLFVKAQISNYQRHQYSVDAMPRDALEHVEWAEEGDRNIY